MEKEPKYVPSSEEVKKAEENESLLDKILNQKRTEGGFEDKRIREIKEKIDKGVELTNNDYVALQIFGLEHIKKMEIEEERERICLNFMEDVIPELEKCIKENKIDDSFIKRDLEEFSIYDEENADYIMKARGFALPGGVINEAENSGNWDYVLREEAQSSLAALNAYYAYKATKNYYYFACFKEALRAWEQYRVARLSHEQE